ncbi:proline-rich acidic protein 1 isoform X2 [Ascaphus truei]|uniref:proline-rich acidic protein 1 isoform X2 n=1 Tax=Ascaphus truei TaxID=8439 RepID=UPI003F5ACDB3
MYELSFVLCFWFITWCGRAGSRDHGQLPCTCSTVMMGNPLTLSCVVALLILTMVPSKALTDEEERQRSMKRDIELGLLAIEPLPKEETSHDIDPGMKIFQEAEEDRDHLYHPPPETPREIRRAPLRLKYQQAPNEPEEDRDHLYHP